MKRLFNLLSIIVLPILCAYAAPSFSHQNGPSGLDENGQQAVHSQTNIIYANDGEEVSLRRPDKNTFVSYLRWYNYDTDKAADNISSTDTYTYKTADGWFVKPGTNAMELTYTMQDYVYRIAADQSAYNDYTFTDSKIIEPTLSKRLIYEMHPASEIAARVDTCTTTSYLEYHKITAPTGRQLYIGPDYYFVDQYVEAPNTAFSSYDTRSNYFYNAAAPVRMCETGKWIWSVDGTATTFTPVTGQFIGVSSSTPGTVTYTLQYKESETITLNISSIKSEYYISSQDGFSWHYGKKSGSSRIIPIANFGLKPGDKITFTPTTTTNARYTFLKSNTLSYVDYCDGYGTNAAYLSTKKSKEETIPYDCKYIYVQNTDNYAEPTITIKNTNPIRTYNIAKFEVVYMDVNEVGPLADITDNDMSGLELIYENTFNYNTQLGTTQTWYSGHINVDESSYGYYFSDKAANHYTTGGQRSDVYWSEYGFTNKHLSWYDEKTYGYNHGTNNNEDDANDGYFLYCDGSEIPGQVFNLNVKAELCAGSIMYFSAWVMDLSSNNSSAPNIDFVVTGIRSDGSEDQLTTFTTGEFGVNASMTPTATWYQILFPIEFNSNADYTSYRLRINNKGKNAQGNDFGIDDIRIYHQKAPVTPIQASTYDCPEKLTDTVITYIRVDYQAFAPAGTTLYYQWRDYNDQPLNEVYSNNGTPTRGTYGIIPYPTDAEIAKNTCTSLLDFDDLYKDTQTPVIKYIEEQVGTGTADKRYVMYIAQPIYARTNYKYSGYVATNIADLGDRGECGRYADLLVVGGARLMLDEDLVGDSVVDVCGNHTYRLDMVLVYIEQDDATGTLVKKTSKCKADWLVGDSAIVRKNYSLYNATFEEIDAALQAHHKSATTAQQEALINRLVRTGLLTLDTTSINAQIPEHLDYTAFPIDGTAENNEPVCTTPRFLHFNPSVATINMLVIGDSTDVLPEEVSMLPRKVRISDKQKGKAEFYTHTYVKGDKSIVYEVDSVLLISSTCPNYKKINIHGEFTDNKRDTLHVYGNELSTLTSGYDYTFRVKFKDEEDACNLGQTYFTLRIIPDTVIWQGGHWNVDNSWDSFIPLSETNVILKDTDYAVTFSSDSIYDINYVRNQCNNIYIPSDASLYGQEDIIINGQAYIDIKEYAWKWTLTAFPIQGVVTGDLFIPQNESTRPFVVANINQSIGARANDRYIFEVYNSEFDKTTLQWKTATNALDRQIVAGDGTMIGIDCDDDTTNPTIRLPKQDNLYYYWLKDDFTFEDKSANITRGPNYGKLIYSGDNDFTLKETYDKIYVFGNPTLAYIDITQLVQENANLFTGKYHMAVNGEKDRPTTGDVCDKDVYTEAYHVLLPPFRGCLLEGKTDSDELTINVYKKSLNKAGRVAQRNEYFRTGDITTNNEYAEDNNLTNNNNVQIFDMVGRLIATDIHDLPTGGIYLIKCGNKVQKVLL